MKGGLPAALSVECKFTTGTTIVIPRRERDALVAIDGGRTGIVAALFWCGQRDYDGRWLIVDAAETLRAGRGATTTLSLADLGRIEKSQAWLDPIRLHVRNWWNPFLMAYRDEALSGHEGLLSELRTLHEDNALRARVTKEHFLDLEHRRAMQEILSTHGPSVAGHIFQDLFAYLLALAGYMTVRLNPIGVPDIELSDLRSKATRKRTVRLTGAELANVYELCRAAGAQSLAELFRPARLRRK